MTSRSVIEVSEYCRPLHRVQTPFDEKELEILENEFKKNVEIVFGSNREQSIRTQEYVGYIILPNHIISIFPKIPQISFFNMIKYALKLPEIEQEHLKLSEENNYYDILVRFLLNEIEKLLQRELNKDYRDFDENLSCVRGKILFNEHLKRNYDRGDRIFCSFSELSLNIKENQIIKYTLSYLSQCLFLDSTINSEILKYRDRLYEIDLVPVSTETFNTLEFTPLNEHYKPIITLCELFLRNSSLDEEVGKKTANSFLIDMNLLFEKFVVNLLKKRLDGYEVEEQKKIFLDTARILDSDIDILISRNKKPLLILDTKYKKFENKPESNDVHQIISYSTSMNVKYCCLIYPEKMLNHEPYFLHQNINLYTISIDLGASNKTDFEGKCHSFMQFVSKTLSSI